MARIIVLCGILAIAVFSVQLALCIKPTQRNIKRIPVFLIIALYVIALILPLLDLMVKGGVAIWSIFAFIIAIANTVALIADAVAWIVYRQIQNKKNDDLIVN